LYETLKARVNLLVYSSRLELRRAIEGFIEISIQRRYHKEIGSVALADVCYRRWEATHKRREEQKRITLEQRFRYNLSRLNQTTTGKLSLEP
jgi:hypothetical protein